MTSKADVDGQKRAAAHAVFDRLVTDKTAAEIKISAEYERFMASRTKQKLYSQREKEARFQATKTGNHWADILADLYRDGNGVEVDLSEAARLYRMAAGQGDEWAQNSLAEMYCDGVGVEVDLKEAARLYRMAAEQGNECAQGSLADMYRDGHGVGVDLSEAARLYRMAADQGFCCAQES